jgi:hypothetical protein
MGNTTTIEGWEKDKLSVLVKKGRAREVYCGFICSNSELIFFPLNLGQIRICMFFLLPNVHLLWLKIDVLYRILASCVISNQF